MDRSADRQWVVCVGRKDIQKSLLAQGGFWLQNVQIFWKLEFRFGAMRATLEGTLVSLICNHQLWGHSQTQDGLIRS